MNYVTTQRLNKHGHCASSAQDAVPGTSGSDILMEREDRRRFTPIAHQGECGQAQGEAGGAAPGAVERPRGWQGLRVLRRAGVHTHTHTKARDARGSNHAPHRQSFTFFSTFGDSNSGSAAFESEGNPVILKWQ